MKKFAFILLLPFFSHAEEPPKKSFSFYKGYSLCQRWVKDSEFPLDFEDVLEGMREAYKQDKNLELSEEELENLQNRFYNQIKEEKLAESNHFLKEIAQNKGVKELIKDKLYYQIEKNGSGQEIGERPLILYTAKALAGGKEEQIHHTLKPEFVLLKSTIDGFSQGVKGMVEGEKRIIYIHPDLAYGATSAKMPPNALMIFEVEVVPSSKIDLLPN